MYIAKVVLENIRCFERITINLENGGNIWKWQTILGDNAVGKSTILKCIAMGLCDESSASALMKEENGEFIRKGESKGSIKIWLKENEDEKEHIVTTNLYKDPIESPEKLRQEDVPSNLSLWKDVFMCGYGVQIGDGGGETYENYKPLEAVYTLFNSGSELQNTEAIMFKQTEHFRSRLSITLQRLLMLEDYPEIEYNNRGMFVSGPWGKLRVNELSDGYRRVIQLVVDFFGWQIIANRLTPKSKDITGIILIDEMETHLHPIWQRYIVDRFNKYLPKVQFVVTTHSPLVALGTSDLKDSLLLELDLINESSNKVRFKNKDASTYKGYSVDQILTSSAFDVPIARSGVAGDKLMRFRTLFVSNDRTTDEEKEYLILKSEIDSEFPELGEVEQDRQMQREVKKLLERINNEINDSTK